MRVLIAPQEFKGSLTAAQAAAAIAAGVRAVAPTADLDLAPMSDGGPGLVDAMLSALGGRRIEALVHDPLMRPIGAEWALLADSAAVIEMAAASGLVLLEPEERDPMVATTYGTGELIIDALKQGCTRIIVGVGGSATVDAGAGAMQALGARLLDTAGADLPPGGAALARLDHIDLTRTDRRLDAAAIRVASDVTNTLCGPEGAAAVFGPQKGASPEDVDALDLALRNFAKVALRDTGIDVVSLPGSGAAGGLGAGLAVIAGATIEPGFPLVAEASGLEERIARADLVITGEGRLDAQTAYGKTAAGVAELARKHGKRVVAIGGTVTPGDYRTFDDVVSATPDGMPIEDAMRNAEALLRSASSRVMAMS